MKAIEVLFDEALEATMRLNMAAAWFAKAKKLRPATMPFAITGLDDPAYLEAMEHEAYRLDQLQGSRNELRHRAQDMRDTEQILKQSMPRGVLIRHVWNNRVFAVGMTKCGVFQAQILRDDWNIGELVELDTANRSRRVVPLWEHLAWRLV